MEFISAIHYLSYQLIKFLLYLFVYYSKAALHARELSNLEGVDGLDLLAYRFSGEVPRLIQRVKQASVKPLIVAGSICDQERIEVVKKAQVQGFTIGTTVFEHRFFPAKKELQAQLQAILAEGNR